MTRIERITEHMKIHAACISKLAYATALASSHDEDSALANRLINNTLAEYSELLRQLVEPILPEQTIEQ